MFEHAYKFWIESTHPNPNPSKVRVIFDHINRTKTIHSRHICYDTYSSIYDDYCAHQTTIDLCAKYKKPIPSKVWFLRLRPAFIYPVDHSDFSNCSVHSNWSNLNRALLSIIYNKKYHNCNSEHCPINKGLFELSLTKFIKTISCPTICSSLYPNAECIISKCNKYKCHDSKCIHCLHSICDQDDCGVAHLRNILNGTACSNLSIPNELQITFDFHRSYDTIAPKKKTETKTKKMLKKDSNFIPLTLSWADFIPFYCKEYLKYSKHHITYIYQFRTRRDFIDTTQTKIPLNALVSHFDFINNIKPTSQIKTQSQWSNRDGITLLSVISRYIGENAQTNESSYNYMSSDPKHDWPAAIYLVEKHIQNKKKFFKDELHRDLTVFYGYSDRGEFSSSGFLAALSLIKPRLGLDRLVWTFTCPQHGKCKCDAEGHTIKTCVRSGVNGNKIKYNPTIENYDITLIRYLNEKLMKDQTLKRKFFSIDINAINHIKQHKLCTTMDKISQYHQFDIRSNSKILRRTLDCKCTHCLSVDPMDWDAEECDNGHLVGKWEEYKMKLKTFDDIWKNNNDENPNNDDDKNSVVANGIEFQMILSGSDSERPDDSESDNDHKSENSNDANNHNQSYREINDRIGHCFEFCQTEINDDMLVCGICNQQYHLQCAELTGYVKDPNRDYQCTLCYNELLGLLCLLTLSEDFAVRRHGKFK